MKTYSFRILFYSFGLFTNLVFLLCYCYCKPIAMGSNPFIWINAKSQLYFGRNLPYLLDGTYVGLIFILASNPSIFGRKQTLRPNPHVMRSCNFL
jgi:hypothetical protein